MAKSLIEHVNDYNDVIERKIARLEARGQKLEAEIEELEAEYEEEIKALEAEYETEELAEIDRGSLDQAVAKRCKSEKKQKILGKVNTDIKNTNPFVIDSALLERHNSTLLRLRKVGGGARKAWGGWSTTVPSEPLGRMSSEWRDSIRAEEEERREKGEAPRDLRKLLGGNKRRVPEQTYKGDDEKLLAKSKGKVFTHKEIRALNAGKRRDFAQMLIDSEYPPKIIYDVTGLSRFMQTQFAGEELTLTTQG
jgi:hypothetical protein